MIKPDIVVCNGREKWLEIFGALKQQGKLCSPRDLKILEIEDFHIDVDPLTDRFCSFAARALSLKYLVGEFGWYLAADPNDDTIIIHSEFWKNIQNPWPEKPRWNSNYGVPIFDKGGFQYAFQSLIDDKDSRQACIVINRQKVMQSRSKDKICTNALMFRIRDGRLNMTVQMRSNDAVLGLCYDLPIFSFIMEMMLVALRDKYPELEMGVYHHTAGSFHIYEKHFEMMEEIIADKGVYHVLNVPRMDPEDWRLRWTLPLAIKKVMVTREPRAISCRKPSFTYTILEWLIRNPLLF